MRLEQVVKEPTLLLVFMQVISGGRSYAERKQLLLILIEGMIMGFISFLVVLSILVAIIDAGRPHPGAKPNFLFILSNRNSWISRCNRFGDFYDLVDYFHCRSDQQIDWTNRSMNIDAVKREKIGLSNSSSKALDGNWHLFRNIDLPGRNRGDWIWCWLVRLESGF